MNARIENHMKLLIINQIQDEQNISFSHPLPTFGILPKRRCIKTNGERDDYFSVPENANDPESVIRRKFYTDHGVHVLFNDTLRHEQRGTYADGTPYWFTETVDLSYSQRQDLGKLLQFELSSILKKKKRMP